MGKEFQITSPDGKTNYYPRTKAKCVYMDDDISQTLEGYVESALEGKADDSAVVHKTGDESIYGNKTFNDVIIIPDYSSIQDEAETKTLADKLDEKLPLSGGTMSGNIGMKGQKLVGATDSTFINFLDNGNIRFEAPCDTNDKAFFTFGKAGVNLGNGTTAIVGVTDKATIKGTMDMTSHQIANVADPTSDTDAANKEYVDENFVSCKVNQSLELQDRKQARENISANAELVAGDNITITDNADGTQTISASGGGASSEWELLIDNTTTEDDGAISQWKYAQGDSGQTFDDYSEIFIYVVCEPNADATGTTVTRVSIANNETSAWNGKYSIAGTGSSKTITTYSTAILRKVGYGIFADLKGSANATTISTSLNNYNGSYLILLSGVTANAVNDASIQTLYQHFDHIYVGSYTAIFGVGSRLVVYGKK